MCNSWLIQAFWRKWLKTSKSDTYIYSYLEYHGLLDCNNSVSLVKGLRRVSLSDEGYHNKQIKEKDAEVPVTSGTVSKDIQFNRL